MTAEEKQRLKEYQKNYRKARRTTTYKNIDIFLTYKWGQKPWAAVRHTSTKIYFTTISLPLVLMK